MLTQARTHAPPPPPPPSKKKGPPNGTVKDLKKTNNKNKSVVLGLTISMLFQQFGRPRFSIFFPGEHAPGPPLKHPSRVSNRPELDENIRILLDNPNRDSISVGTQQQLAQANN